MGSKRKLQKKVDYFLEKNTNVYFYFIFFDFNLLNYVLYVNMYLFIRYKYSTLVLSLTVRNIEICVRCVFNNCFLIIRSLINPMVPISADNRRFTVPNEYKKRQDNFSKFNSQLDKFVLLSSKKIEFNRIFILLKYR